MDTLAIVGGTGLEGLPDAWRPELLRLDTPFGAVEAARLTRPGGDLFFLPRHGRAHAVAPHQVNYRANTAALRELGVKRVLATNAVGSLRSDLPPGTLMLLDDFIDFTRGRAGSFWDQHPDAPAGVGHTDFSEPYCPALRSALLVAAGGLQMHLVPRGVYLCTDGPRFETPAEVRLFASWGADVVGMTGLPEAVFAREAGLCYAAVAIVTNYACGIAPGPVSHGDVVNSMASQATAVWNLLVKATDGVAGVCGCRPSP